jgi:hypothetical protein
LIVPAERTIGASRTSGKPMMQQQIMVVGQRRVELRMQAAELEARRH